jgi:hypothetical protein
MAQGDVVATDSLEVFVNLIDTLGKFCNFDQKLDTKGKLGEVIGSKFPTYAKVGQAAEFVGLHMRNLLFFETSEQRKVTPVVLAAALYERMESDCSVRISFAKTDPLPKRTSGGKPVQGHGSVALTNPAQGEFASKKCSNMF